MIVVFYALLLIILHLVVPNHFSSDDNDEHRLDLCDRLSSGQLDHLQLQAFTFLEKDRDRINLMERNQFYLIRGLMDLAKQGGNLIQAREWDFLHRSEMLRPITMGSREVRQDTDPIDLVTVFKVANEYEPVESGGMRINYLYYGLVRTTATVHVVLMKQIYNVQQGYGELLSTLSKRFPNTYPHFTVIPHPESGYDSNFVLQDDTKFHQTGSPVLYRLNFTTNQEPILARTLSDASGKRLELFYLVASSSNPSQVTLMSTTKDQAGTLAAVKQSPLLHRTPVGFATDDRVLYLLEPVIGCVYIVQGFGTEAIGLNFPPHSTTLSLARVPIERFFKCDGSNKGGQHFPKDRYPPDRCDSVERTKHFFDHLPSPSSSSSLSPFLIGGAVLLLLVAVVVVSMVVFCCVYRKHTLLKHERRKDVVPKGAAGGTRTTNPKNCNNNSTTRMTSIEAHRGSSAWAGPTLLTQKQTAKQIHISNTNVSMDSFNNKTRITFTSPDGSSLSDASPFNKTNTGRTSTGVRKKTKTVTWASRDNRRK